MLSVSRVWRLPGLILCTAAQILDPIFFTCTDNVLMQFLQYSDVFKETVPEIVEKDYKYKLIKTRAITEGD